MKLTAIKHVNNRTNDCIIAAITRTKTVRDERLPRARLVPVSHIGLLEKDGQEYVFYVPHRNDIGGHGCEYISVNKVKYDQNDDQAVVTTEIIGGLLMFKREGFIPAILNHNAVKHGARITAVIPIFDEDGNAENSETFIWGGDR